jgi:Transposase DDE domain
MKMQDLEEILTKFKKIVSPNFCYDLAKRVGLIQRSTSRLKGYEFAQALMIPNGFLDRETLNSLATRMQTINKECDLTAPALAQRMNTKAAKNFMKSCFEKVFNNIVKKSCANLIDLQNLTVFNRILIEDSTQAELDEKLSPYFKGCGGSASKAALKINFIFDYLSEQFIDIRFFPGNKPDQSLAGHVISMLEKGDLVIRDLGYYALDKIKQIEQKSCFYISRFKSEISIYEDEEAVEVLDLAKCIEKHIHNGVVDIKVYIGKEKFPSRLIACLMSEEAINQRRRAASRTAQRHGQKISEKKLKLLKYAIFITNVPAKMLSAISIMATYRARWRIELIFKEWKSCLKIHLFKGHRIERFYCLLYGRLIMVLLVGSISPFFMAYAYKLDKELSCYKLINYLTADHVFAIALTNDKIYEFIYQLLQDLPKRLCKDKRKRSSLRVNVRLGNSYYTELQAMDLERYAA